jgi:hypothetical protein
LRSDTYASLNIKTLSNVTAGLDSVVKTRSKKSRGRLNNLVNAKES